MSRRIIAVPTGGIPGEMQEEDGTRVKGVYRLVALVFDPGEEIPSWTGRATRKKTFREWKAEHWNAAKRALVIPFANGAFTFGPELLSATEDDALVVLRTEFSYRPAGATK